MAAVRRAKLTGTVNWSDGSPFNGYAWISINPPIGSTTWPSISLGDTLVKQEVPPVFPIPIRNGQYADTARLFYTADMVPPNSRYAAYFSDLSRKRVDSGTPTLFTITSDPHTLTPPTLTLPTTPVTPSVVPDFS
jgi:hypothetical protein